MSPEINRQFILKETPQGTLEASHFEYRETEPPTAGEGEVLGRTLYLSLDAANRAWMQGATYKSAVLPGEVMHGYAVSEVVASNDPKFVPGDLVEGLTGWQECWTAPAKQLAKVVQRGELSHHLSVLGVTGLTAYFGLLEVGKPKAGETVAVSAAAGAVGNVVGQIAKIKGCRTVGFAGTDEKCQWLKDELGYDEAINYKGGRLPQKIKKACPDGIDVYFDNTGGDILQNVLFQMNDWGRIACCGVVSQYDTANPAHGPAGVPGLLVVKRITMQGFIVMDYYKKLDQALDEMSGWIADGKLKVVEDVIEGLENAPAALVGLLAGENLGKRMIKVG